ncbi:MAG TPA: lantibiotic dehydratase C-terminal domain-containing protein [Thermoanaerobaculia bacterium]|nr:lantibiotic dehydratase C-terminal domain-containing protein [Thermoanaerobaculia bacterium]
MTVAAAVDVTLADPRLTSSIYCAGHLDELLHRGVAPLWRASRAAGVGGYLWLMRYARCGEHLKVRFHGSPREAEDLRRALADAVEEVFARLPPPTAAERELNEHLFAVDPEDLATEPYPDRTLLWTRYRRWPGTMGREPLSDDLGLAALFTRCLGAGCEHVLDELVPDETGRFRQSLRTRIVLDLLLCGLSTLGFPPREAARYLDYHRDWLILGGGGELDPTHRLFAAKLEREVADLAPFAGAYRRSAEEGPQAVLAPWSAALGDLARYTCELAGVDVPWQPDDPYERDQVLAPLFKSLHGLANLVRVGLYNEAYLCHLLGRALA